MGRDPEKDLECCQRRVAAFEAKCKLGQIALEILRLNAVMRSWEALLVAESNCVSYHERRG